MNDKKPGASRSVNTVVYCLGVGTMSLRKLYSLPG